MFTAAATKALNGQGDIAALLRDAAAQAQAEIDKQRG